MIDNIRNIVAVQAPPIKFLDWSFSLRKIISGVFVLIAICCLGAFFGPWSTKLNWNVGKKLTCFTSGAILIVAVCWLNALLSTKAALTLGIAVLTFASGVFAYLFQAWNSNQTTLIESKVKKELQLHSEAEWRPKLFELMAKDNPTYDDVLYFTAFFNPEKQSESDNDFKIRQALDDIFKDDSQINVNETLEKLYGQGSFFAAKLAKEIANQSKNNQPQSNGELSPKKEVIFKACISFLLKDDWTKQQEKIQLLADEIVDKDEQKKGDKKRKFFGR